MELPTRHFQVAATKSLFDDFIDRHAEAYLSAYPEIKEFSAFEKSGTFNYYIGMIWTNDCEKPDERQLRVRGSQALCKNKLVELDLSAVDSQQSFFPGQIVAFQADPFLDTQLTVKKFLDPLMIAPRMKKIDTNDKINLLITYGPFMQPDLKEWTLFDRTIDAIKSYQATHVVIIGPMVDIENNMIRGEFDIAWKTIFDKLVESLHDHECHIYLVPSSRDILTSDLSATYFYPCPKLTFKYNNIKSDVTLKCNVESVTDPAQIDLGGIYLDVTSADILFHMNKCTMFKNKAPGSPFSSLSRHLITHGIYPLYPAPTDIAVDHPKLAKHIQLDRLAPHIIVLPTRFNASVDSVENRLIVTVQKCSLKKQAILIQIPPIAGDQEIDSVVVGGSTEKFIDLVGSLERGASQS